MKIDIETRYNESDIETAKDTNEGQCLHYWRIETPNGPTSRGICKWCGAEREFVNALP